MYPFFSSRLVFQLLPITLPTQIRARVVLRLTPSPRRRPRRTHRARLCPFHQRQTFFLVTSATQIRAAKCFVVSFTFVPFLPRLFRSTRRALLVRRLRQLSRVTVEAEIISRVRFTPQPRAFRLFRIALDARAFARVRAKKHLFPVALFAQPLARADLGPVTQRVSASGPQQRRRRRFGRPR